MRRTRPSLAALSVWQGVGWGGESQSGDLAAPQSIRGKPTTVRCCTLKIDRRRLCESYKYAATKETRIDSVAGELCNIADFNLRGGC